MDVSYASTLKVGDVAYIWNGDVRMPSKVLEVNGRTVRTGYGEFGRKTGKACGWAKLANVAGSRSYYLASEAGEKMITVVEASNV